MTRRDDLLGLVGWGAATLFAGVFALGGVQFALSLGLGYDAHAYWAVWDGGPYDAAPLERDAYLYSPVFAQLIWPLTQLPFAAFFILWAVLQAAAFIWLLRPLGRRWMLPALLLCLPEVATGNVYGLLAVALVVFVRHPGAVALPLLTKVLPAVPMLLFLLLRGRVRDLLHALLLCLLGVSVSALLAPDLWYEWLSFLSAHSASSSAGGLGLPLWLSVVARATGVALCVVSAGTRRPSLLAGAVICFSPTLGLNTLTMLTAVPRLRRHEQRRQPAPVG